MPRHPKSKRARVLLKRLEQTDFRERCQYTEDQMKALDQIAAGRPQRYAMATMKALELKAAYAYQKPPAKVEVDTGPRLAEALIAAKMQARATDA